MHDVENTRVPIFPAVTFTTLRDAIRVAVGTEGAQVRHSLLCVLYSGRI